jgi:adenylate cyclase
LTRDQRRLAAIVSADVVGYSLLMGRDDSATLAGLKAHRRELIDPKIAEYGGRIVKTTGDGLLLEFPSVVDAVRCAVDVQRGMAERNADVPPEQRIDLRIGINVGDIIIDGEDIFGDGVNVAARLQTLAEPGGICVSRVVRDQVLDKLSFAFEDLGPQDVKNIARPVEVYRVDLGSGALQTPSLGRRRWQRLTRALGWRWLAAGVLALGVAGGAAWLLPQFWKSAPPPTPPAMSVAIAPLTAPAGDANALRLAEVLTRNVVTRLSREGGWASRPRARVVSASSDATRGPGAIDARELARNVNVRYVLEGDVIRSGDRYTVNLRLVDAATGGQVWSERDTWQDSDISAESSTELRNLSVRLRAALDGAETRRVVAQPLSGLSAMELVLRALDVGRRDQSLVGTLEARKLVDEALRLDPNLLPALKARILLTDRENDVDPNPDHDRIVRDLDQFTNRAISLDQTDPVLWDFRGYTLIYLGRWDAALEANAMAIKLDPYEQSHYGSRASLMNMTGRPAEALTLVDRALALDPANAGITLRVACEAHLLLGQAEQTIATCEKAAGVYTDWILDLFLAAAYANHGDMAKAAVSKADALRIVPGYTIAQLRAKRYSDNPEYLKLAEKYWYEGLRKAGFPEQ